jgi:predicted esterase
MCKLFDVLGFSSKKKVILLGYDLGGAIALSTSINKQLARTVELCIVFHPTWTDKI